MVIESFIYPPLKLPLSCPPRISNIYLKGTNMKAYLFYLLIPTVAAAFGYGNYVKPFQLTSDARNIPHGP